MVQKRRVYRKQKHYCSTDAKQFNCAFCDTSMNFCTHLVWPIRSYSKTGPQPDLACGGGGSHLKNGWHEYSMSDISANNIDRKLIIVSRSMFSGSRNPNLAIIWVCGGCGSHFRNGRHEFSMSHISANNIDRKLIFVFLSLLSGSQNPNMVNILGCGVCGSHFQNGRHEYSMSHISANNIDRKLIIVSISMLQSQRIQFGQLYWSMRAVAVIFKMATMNFQCPISRRII